MNPSSLSTLFRAQSSTPALAALLFLSGSAYAQKTTRILGPGGVEPNGNMNTPYVSQDGNAVVFSAGATNLFSSDANGAINDVFRYDISSQAIELISKNSAGVQSNAFSAGAVCSADGDRIVYWSTGTNLDPADTSSDRDVFLHDRTNGTTVLVSPGPVAFHSWDPFISPNGDWVVFLAEGGLVAGDINGVVDVYRYEVATGALTLASLTDAGALGTVACSGPVSISNSGNFVVFESAGAFVNPDGNGATDVFIRDFAASKTVRVAGMGEPNFGAVDGHVSANGQWVSFTSASTNFVTGDTNGVADVFVWGRITGNFTLISRRPTDGVLGDGPSGSSRLSRYGQYVTFSSEATNLVADTNGVRDAFWFDRQTKSLALISVATDGTQADAGPVGFVTVAQGGGLVAYQSDATNLVPDDTTVGAEAMLGWRSPDATTFCVGKVNSLTCLAIVDAIGTASIASGQTFDITAANILNNKNGLFFYGLQGAAELPFQGGTLCVFPPLKRTTITNSQGNVGPSDCSGLLQFDFNAWLQGGNDPNLGVGLEVNGQFWSRDPQSSFGIGLSGGVRFVICP